MKDKFIKYVTMSDILGEPVSLRINNETTSKTFIGGLFTIQLVLAIIVIFWVFSLDMINHDNPLIAEETQILLERPKIVMNKTTIQFAFGITNDQTGIVDKPTYFQYSVAYILNNNSANSVPVIQYLNIRKCISDDFPNISEEIFLGISLNYMYCINNFNNTISGFWDELSIEYLDFKVSYCQNSTEYKNCANLKEIKEFIRREQFYFNIYMINTAINPKNYSVPVTKYMFTQYSQFSSHIFKLVEVYIRQQQLHSDDSLIFTSDYRNDSWAFDYSEKDNSEIGIDNTLIEYAFYSSNKFIIYHRTYKKISEVLADVGGLSSVFLFILKVMCYVFTSVKHDEQILNKIFDFDLEEVQKNFSDIQTSNNFKERNVFPKRHSSSGPYQGQKINGIQKIEKSCVSNSSHEMSIKMDSSLCEKDSQTRKKVPGCFTMRQINNKNYIPSISFVSYNSNTPDNNFTSKMNKFTRAKLRTLSKMNKFQNPQINNLVQIELKNEDHYENTIKTILKSRDKYKLNFSFCEIIRVFIFPCLKNKKIEHKLKLYKKSEALLEVVLDISYIVHKLDEYDKFKTIMMTKQQLALFNFIAKDICSLNTDKLKNSTINEMRQFINSEETLAKILIEFLEKLSKENNEENIPEVDKKLFSFLNDEFKVNLLTAN